MILDGNCLSGKDSDQDLCHLSLSIVQNQHAAMEYSNSAGGGMRSIKLDGLLRPHSLF